jgi:hypothetical protein
MNLEHDLRRALRRESPPAGFAGRVMQRIEVEDRQSCLSGQTRWAVLHQGWWRAAAATVMLAAVLGGYRIHEIRKGEQAKEQILRAMSIASEKAAYAQKQVREIGSH